MTVVMNAAALRPAEVAMNTGLGSAPILEDDMEVRPGVFSLMLAEGFVVWRIYEEVESAVDRTIDKMSLMAMRLQRDCQHQCALHPGNLAVKLNEAAIAHIVLDTDWRR